MLPDHILRALGEPAISSMSRVEVLVARIAPGLRLGVERGENLLLDRHVLEHRLDHEVGMREAVIGQLASISARRWSNSSGEKRPFLTVLS